jgi:hypothetical protein
MVLSIEMGATIFLVVISKEKMTIFKSMNSIFSKYIYERNKAWTKVKSLGLNLSSRAFFSLTSTPDGNLFMFGGKEMRSNRVLNDHALLNIRDMHWTEPFIGGIL